MVMAAAMNVLKAVAANLPRVTIFDIVADSRTPVVAVECAP